MQQPSSALVSIRDEDWCLTQALFWHVSDKQQRKQAKKCFHRWFKRTEFQRIQLEGLDLKQLRAREFVEKQATVAVLVRLVDLAAIIGQFGLSKSSYTAAVPHDMDWVRVDLPSVSGVSQGQKRPRNLQELEPNLEGEEQQDGCKFLWDDWNLDWTFDQVEPLDFLTPPITISPSFAAAQTPTWLMLRDFVGHATFQIHGGHPMEFLEQEWTVGGVCTLLPALPGGSNVTVLAGNQSIAFQILKA